MGLNPTKGNMYGFVTDTWNVIKGACPHDCSYCYMKKWGHLRDTRFDEKELSTDLGNDRFIFIGSSCDMWADTLPIQWCRKVLEYKTLHRNNTGSNNRYLFQTKNPKKFITSYIYLSTYTDILCTTLETNKIYPCMGNTPTPWERAQEMNNLHQIGFKTMVTIEPALDFDIKELYQLVKMCEPFQVNIGSDSCHNHLPEPPKEKIIELISELEKFTIVYQKKNLRRLVA